MNRVRKIAGFLCLILSLSLVVTGCKQSPSEEKAETPGASTVSPKSVQQDTGPKLLKAGETAVCENFEVTLLSLKRASEYTKTPKAGQGYAVLRFRVKNIGQEVESGTLGSCLNVKDAESGIRSSAERTTGVKVEYPKSYDVAPGAEGEFEDVYLMSNALSEVEFQYLKGYNPKEIARWMMTIE